ncbi:alpha-amylase family glycosyl hydrolase [Bacillus sp. AFS041924]|uniref:alpha-amylase family glycosyl hydrolase n=1 Tax=Bacillus sp. AFS041924 TaxID=2033503 RepID=UPI000BFCE9DE|nr:alpha-amylase family glycosyl hydrolase [Bacillus sp. AFS041924]PGS51016.1 alpha-amlyase [Bacillus sp. AFS041924]
MRRFGFLILVSVLFFSTLPSISFAENNTTDLKKEMIYRILVDRFFNGNPQNDKNTDPKDLNKSQGGDLAGITTKLDYLKDFGYNAISISTIFENDENSYDGFSVTNFRKIDSRFGTTEDLKKLVKEAHKRKIKVYIDFVANNTSPNSALAKKANWFNPENSTSSEEKWINGLPDFNLENKEVANYLVETAKYWMNQADFDGYNLQEVNNVPVSFWESFNKEIKKKNPNFILFADLNNSSEIDLGKYKNLDFDGIYNVDSVDELANTFSSQNQSLTDIMKRQMDLNKQLGSTLMINYLDDEMTKRFVSIAEAKGQYPPSRLKLALAYLFTSPGIPLTYYGTEIALNGGNIPDNRKGMDFRTDEDFSNYIEKLTELRRTLPSLSHGDFEVLYDSKGMTLIKRHYNHETTLVAINNTSLDHKVHLDFNEVKKSNELRGMLSDDLVRPNKKGFDIVLKRESSNVYAVAPKTSLNIGVIIAIPSIFVAFIIFLWLARRRSNKVK